jgi:hypothetical protein
VRKWIFISGILVCCFLFFISGTLIGSFVSQEEPRQKVIEKKKVSRKPSLNFRRITENIKTNAVSRMRARIPIPSAVYQAKTLISP